MSEQNDAAPHVCTGHFVDEPERACRNPAYNGFGVGSRCVQKGCVNYDADLWAEWVSLVPDDGLPKNTEPDFFALEEEDTNPGYRFTPAGTVPIPQTQPYGSYLDNYGKIIGVPRNLGESDDDYYDRLLACYGNKP